MSGSGHHYRRGGGASLESTPSGGGDLAAALAQRVELLEREKRQKGRRPRAVIPCSVRKNERTTRTGT